MNTEDFFNKLKIAYNACNGMYKDHRPHIYVKINEHYVNVKVVTTNKKSVADSAVFKIATSEMGVYGLFEIIDIRSVLKQLKNFGEYFTICPDLYARSSDNKRFKMLCKCDQEQEASYDNTKIEQARNKAIYSATFIKKLFKRVVPFTNGYMQVDRKHFTVANGTSFVQVDNKTPITKSFKLSTDIVNFIALNLKNQHNVIVFNVEDIGYWEHLSFSFYGVTFYRRNIKQDNVLKNVTQLMDNIDKNCEEIMLNRKEMLDNVKFIEQFCDCSNGGIMLLQTDAKKNNVLKISDCNKICTRIMVSDVSCSIDVHNLNVKPKHIINALKLIDTKNVILKITGDDAPLCITPCIYKIDVNNLNERISIAPINLNISDY